MAPSEDPVGLNMVGSRKTTKGRMGEENSRRIAWVVMETQWPGPCEENAVGRAGADAVGRAGGRRRWARRGQTPLGAQGKTPLGTQGKMPLGAGRRHRWAREEEPVEREETPLGMRGPHDRGASTTRLEHEDRMVGRASTTWWDGRARRGGTGGHDVVGRAGTTC
jgi:hypothetical protein